MKDYRMDALNPGGTLKDAIKVRSFSPSDSVFLQHMILSLYFEDSSIVSMDIVKIDKTIEALQNDPEKGTILIFEYQAEVIGYSILINYWSNEYGGNITCIDELYILPEYRNKGIATAFFDRLFTACINQSVAFQLEVTPKNKSALKLYEKLGFKVTKNQYYRYLPG